MKWFLLISFAFISTQALSVVDFEFENVHQLSFETEAKEELVIVKPLEETRLTDLQLHLVQDSKIAAKR